MLKKVLMLTALLIVTLFLLGSNDGKEYTERVVEIDVVSGDTLDGIAERFYDKDKRGISWAVYRNEVMELNRNLQNRVRCLQVGDVVEVRYYE